MLVYEIGEGIGALAFGGVVNKVAQQGRRDGDFQQRDEEFFQGFRSHNSRPAGSWVFGLRSWSLVPASKIAAKAQDPSPKI